MKKLFWRHFFLIALFFGMQAGLATSQTTSNEPKTSLEWFQRASNLMNIRMPGAKPFHMKVVFHAYPGMELVDKKKKPEIIAGDGIYEETWLAPHTWRREVTLADYHAIEVEGETGRKMHISSDYEPSRVLMLLDAVLFPIPRNLSSQEFMRDSASLWKIGADKNEKLSLVHINRAAKTEGAMIEDTFFFLPQGLLVFRNEKGLITKWENDIAFDGKALPTHLVVAAGDHDLITADVSIEAADHPASATFDLADGLADPGMTLRPLHDFEVKMPDLVFLQGFAAPRPNLQGAVTLWEVLDRHGRYREMEVINMLDSDHAKATLDQMRGEWHTPPTLDGKPCEVAVNWVIYR